MEDYGLAIGANGRLQQCPYRVDLEEAIGHIGDYRRDDGSYDIKQALEDKKAFLDQRGRVKVCSIRHEKNT